LVGLQIEDASFSDADLVLLSVLPSNISALILH